VTQATEDQVVFVSETGGKKLKIYFAGNIFFLTKAPRKNQSCNIVIYVRYGVFLKLIYGKMTNDRQLESCSNLLQGSEPQGERKDYPFIYISDNLYKKEIIDALRIRHYP